MPATVRGDAHPARRRRSAARRCTRAESWIGHSSEWGDADGAAAWWALGPRLAVGGGVRPEGVPMSAVNDGPTAIRPFRVDIPEEAIVDLRRRIAATRLPEKEPVEDSSQGVQLATMQALVRYWGTEYDLRRVERRLNALPQFMTEIDG